jgi:hypothetical protein
MPKLTLRDLFWTVTLAWWVDHRKMARALRKSELIRQAMEFMGPQKFSP